MINQESVMRKIIVGILCCLAMSPFLGLRAETTEVGVVVLHGKWDRPNGLILDFSSAMERAGYRVRTPEMPWSGRRSYDAGVAVMEAEIDAAVEQLRQQGDAVIALAPGHYPEGKYFTNLTAVSRNRAQALIDDGKPDENGWFDDPNSGGRLKQVKMSARTYLDFFDPDGPMNFGNNAAAVLPGTAVLWVVGQGEESGLKAMAGRVFERLPKELAARQIDVPGGHLETPSNSAGVALDWIRSLKAGPAPAAR
jgi:hypothetical protein